MVLPLEQEEDSYKEYLFIPYLLPVIGTTTQIHKPIFISWWIL